MSNILSKKLQVIVSVKNKPEVENPEVPDDVRKVFEININGDDKDVEKRSGEETLLAMIDWFYKLK